MIAITCPTCGVRFSSYPSNKRIYCSTKCVKSRGIKNHGLSRTRLHGIWCRMKTRCYCKSNPTFKYYGGRGIAVCDEWRQSFSAFMEWAIASGYQNDLEIDRIDVNGSYEPSNCRWATRSQQMRNTRKRSNATTSKYKGVSWRANRSRWIVQIHGTGISRRYVGSFSDEIDAAKAYDAAAKRAYGEFACLNF